MPAPDTVRVICETVASGAPGLVQSTPVIEPEAASENTTVAIVMPTDKFGSVGEGCNATVNGVE